MRDYPSNDCYFVGLYLASNPWMNIEGFMFRPMKWRGVYAYSFNNWESIKYVLMDWGIGKGEKKVYIFKRRKMQLSFLGV